ncbi:GreA/GreB family elongation factor [Winogradskyella sp. SYSU M77433]|uniref:GreA/GreB family elongation factor n=1 Tax=Winogradskyella sp. SYSU M77433 TaxID=3042722 RepID=UPI002481392E|nr:GreA/GreB family elongation factor [Winogradskyella sp. SYSU M77433]MDH7913909.1 GreA/GreB family elongation factor [Winogradskyella sp. SYSU M77433]
MKIKRDLLDLCNQHANKRIADYKNEIELIKESIESNDKVSNEEDDSGNSKLLDDLEKNMNYLNEAQKTKERLQLIKPNLLSDTAVLGSLVKTDSISFFLAISIGKVTLEDEDYYIISIQSPIGQLLKTKKKGDQVEFNGKHYKILEVL